MSAEAPGSDPAILDCTPPWVIDHARRQQRHYRWCEWVHRWVPRRWRARAAARVARQFSPELPDAAKIWRGLREFTGCSDAQAHDLLARWYANQGQFAVALHDYPVLDAHWARDAVRCDEPTLLAQLAERGGLVLTYHSYHHNRSGAFLGLSGCCVWGIAATEVNSLWRPWTGRYVRLINGGSESHFGGGTYLFTDELRPLLKKSREALANGQTVVTLCDNDSDAPNVPRVNIGGRGLRVATGLIELALELRAPITYALFHSDLRGGYRCRLARVSVDATANGAAAQVAQGYADQLMAWCRDEPWAWQGWMWWDDLPPFVPDGVDRDARRAELEARYAASRPRDDAVARALAALGRLEMKLSPPRP